MKYSLNWFAIIFESVEYWLFIRNVVCFLLCDDLLCQSFLLLFSMNFSIHSCVFQIVYGNNLFQLLFVSINSCFCIFYFLNIFSGVGDIFFSLYNVSLILISLINSFVIHGFLFLYFLMENLH